MQVTSYLLVQYCLLFLDYSIYFISVFEIINSNQYALQVFFVFRYFIFKKYIFLVWAIQLFLCRLSCWCIGLFYFKVVRICHIGCEIAHLSTKGHNYSSTITMSKKASDASFLLFCSNVIYFKWNTCPNKISVSLCNLISITNFFRTSPNSCQSLNEWIGPFYGDQLFSTWLQIHFFSVTKFISNRILSSESILSTWIKIPFSRCSESEEL